MKSKSILNYLKYALGEISLLVIGILLAFNLNTWNENRKKSNLTRQYIQEIKQDLNQDKLTFGEQVESINQILTFKKSKINQAEFKESELDELEFLFNSGFSNIKMNNSAYQRYQSSNIIFDGNYSEIIKTIKNYYSFSGEYLNNFNQWEYDVANKEIQYFYFQDFFEVNISPFVDDTIQINQNSKIRNTRKLEFMQSIQSRNILKYGIMRDNTMKDIYTYMIEEANKIITQIENIE
ncbi:MAG TPA: hypothetical protein VLZ75_07270 [Chitinophagales bacterium]|nr:hypothetical protein [Chitinophagales bacterium]